MIIYAFTQNNIASIVRKNYDVSSEFYKGKRPTNGFYVVGYLVKNKDGMIQGILNKDTHFAELAWIDESTIEKV